MLGLYVVCKGLTVAKRACVGSILPAKKGAGYCRQLLAQPVVLTRLLAVRLVVSGAGDPGRPDFQSVSLSVAVTSSASVSMVSSAVIRPTKSPAFSVSSSYSKTLPFLTM